MIIRGRHYFVSLKSWATRHKRLLLMTLAGTVGLLIFIQLFYPSDRLTPFAHVDNLSVSGWQKKDVIKALDQAYVNQPINIYFGNNKATHHSPKPAQVGLTSKNNDRIASLSYPWYLRLIPTSIFWGATLYPDTHPTYSHDQTALAAYMKSALGDSCDVKPVDATLRADGSKLVLVESSNGGTCKLSDVSSTLSKLRPDITKKTDVRIAVHEIAPVVSDSSAEKLAATMNFQLKKGVNIKAGQSTVSIDAKTAASWLDFKTVDGALVGEVNTTRAADYFNKEIAPKVTIAAGVTKVATVDFQEVSRQDGANGQTLNAVATGVAIVDYLTAKNSDIQAATQPVAPSVQYTRSYSPTDVGLSALMTNYAKDHPGKYGAQLIELSGKHRRASYNEGQQFITASTYKLFVAYSTLKRVEDGVWHWSDQINGGRDLAACFDDMIVKSDNNCAQALLTKISFVPITNEMHALGLNDTTFLDKEGIKSTPADLGLFLAMLDSGQMLQQQASRDRLIDAMKRNIYRQGIPAGATGVVADKVGFLDALLHDAAIVYSPSGTYVLVIMTDGSSWANIADLTRQIEALRAQ